MKLNELKDTAISLDDALDRIKGNLNMGYIRLSVKGNGGALYEIAGSNKHGLDIKVEIPLYENRKYVTYSNGYVKNICALGCHNNIHPHDGINFNTTDELIEFLKVTNFKKWKPTREEYEVVEVRYDYRLKL